MTSENEAKSPGILLVFILVLTTAIALLWSYNRLLDQDEAFVLQTDSVASISKLIEVQRHYPISLDPLFYHLLGHASIKIFGATAFAIRLPSLLGYLLMQFCLFALVKRIAGARAGIIAASIPAVTATLFFTQQARPYGVLLGLGALLLFAYQHSTRDTTRAGWLVALALSLALALNTHYFAILLLLPLYAAELARIAQRRSIDWPIVFAILLGSAGALLTLPFQKGAGEFRKHYYNGGRVGLHAVTQSYRALFVNYTDYSYAVQHALMALLVLGMLALATVLCLRLRQNTATPPAPERVFLFMLAALPFFGFLLARFVTHSIEVRYVLPAIIALAALIAIALAPGLRSAIIIPLLPLAIIVGGAERVREARAKQRTALAAMTLSPETRTHLLADPSAKLYVQNVGRFEEALPYITDPLLRARLTLLYSAAEELQWLQHDTGALTAAHLQSFSDVSIARYEDLRRQGGNYLMVLYPPSGWNWIDKALPADGAIQTPAGEAIGGNVSAVQLPPAPEARP